MSQFEAESLDDLRQVIRSFVNEREWEQFHSPKNLSMSIAIEAAELMECFQWQSEGKNPSAETRQQAIDELADVLIYCLALADALDVEDLGNAVLDKLSRSRVKYPVEQFRGKFK